MVVQRKIIRKVNYNDDGRALMRCTDGNGGSFRPSASVCSGADSVCSGTWEVRMSVVLSGALCLTGAASYALTGEIDSARSASVFAFACER